MHLEDKEIAKHIIATLTDNQFKVYVVGGAVRDAMLDQPGADVDLLTNASLKEIRDLFSDQKVRIVGKTFPICMVNGIEICSGRSDFPVSDLARRDFTFNAMACDVKNNIILDPFNGRDDLKKGIVRFTEDPEKRIKEDPVRMIRACRFAAMIDGGFEKNSFEAILACNGMLDNGVAKERIQAEIKKAMGLPKPSLFFEALVKTELLEKIFPSLERCYGLSGGPHHGETVFEHCMLVGDALPSDRPMLRLSGYLHDTGKFDAARIVEGKLTFPGHENDYHHLARDLEQLRFSQRDIAFIKAMTQAHMRPLTDESTPKAVRKLLRMLDDFGLDYRDFMRMRIADRKGNLAKPPYTVSEIRDRLNKLFEQINTSNAFTMSDLKITGHEIARILGIDPGPDIGKVKTLLFEKVIEDPRLNTEQELKKICSSLKIEK